MFPRPRGSVGPRESLPGRASALRAILLKNDRPLGLLAGVLFFLALNFQLFPAHLVYLVPVLVAMERADTLRAATGRAVFACFVCSFLGAYWLLSLVRYSLLAPIIYIIGPSWHALCMSVPLVVAELIRRRAAWPFWATLPPLVVLEDYLFGLGPLRFTVTRWTHALTEWPSTIQFTEWTGSLGVTAWVVIVNTLVHAAWRAWTRGPHAPARRWFLTAAPLLLAAVVPLHGAWRMGDVRREVARADRTVDVVAVQPNINLFDKHDPALKRENTESIVRILREVPAGVDLVALPEASLPGVVRQRVLGPEDPSPPRDIPVAAPAREIGYFLVAGSLHARIMPDMRRELYNAAFLVDPRGRVTDWNAKAYLLPLIETLPFMDRFGIRSIGLGTGGFFGRLGGLTPGEPGRPLVLSGPDKTRARVGVIVCSEAFHPDLVRELARSGADLLACISEDTWYASSPVFARYLSRLVVARCVETRRACVRAANTGISGFVTPDGTFHDATGQWTRTLVRRRLPLGGERTFYVRHGDWPVLLALLWVGAVLGGSLWKGASRRTAQGRNPSSSAGAAPPRDST